MQELFCVSASVLELHLALLRFDCSRFLVTICFLFAFCAICFLFEVFFQIASRTQWSYIACPPSKCKGAAPLCLDIRCFCFYWQEQYNKISDAGWPFLRWCNLHGRSLLFCCAAAWKVFVILMSIWFLGLVSACVPLRLPGSRGDIGESSLELIQVRSLGSNFLLRLVVWAVLYWIDTGAGILCALVQMPVCMHYWLHHLL